MSKENFERFMKQVADSEDLQAKIGKEITDDALVALGAAHGCEFSIEDVQAGAEMGDAELEAVSGGRREFKASEYRISTRRKASAMDANIGRVKYGIDIGPIGTDHGNSGPLFHNDDPVEL